MHKPLNRLLTEEDLTNNFFNNIGKYIKSIQLKSGAVDAAVDTEEDLLRAEKIISGTKDEM